MTEGTLRPQSTLRDYLIKRVLGRGSFGVTYLAERITNHYAVAIKEYFPMQIASRDSDGSTVNVAQSSRGEGTEEFQSGLDDFLEESRTLGGFHSPHIVEVVDTFEHNGTAYMVMKYEEGGTLEYYLKSHQEPLKESQILAIFMPLLEGLKTIHAKWLLHRDIKPENIYIRKDESPLLIDFGTARHAISAKRGGMTEYITPGYAPPEQYDRNADHGPWTDIYAVGATMYYCVTRIKPYEGRSRTGDKDPVIPAGQAAPAMYNKDLLDIIDWMMKPNYQERPQSVEDVLQRLQGLKGALDAGEVEVEQPEAKQKPKTPVAKESPTRRADDEKTEKIDPTLLEQQPKSIPRAPLIAVGLVSLALIIGGGFWYQQKQSADATLLAAATEKARLETELAAPERAQLEAEEAAQLAAEEQARIEKELAVREQARLEAEQEANRLAAETLARREKELAAREQAQLESEQEATRLAAENARIAAEREKALTERLAKEQSNNATATIVFYREWKLVGVGTPVDFLHAGTQIGTLSNKSYFIYRSPTGGQTFRASEIQNGDTAITIELEPNQTYYVDYDIFSDTKPSSLLQVGETEGLATIRNNKLINNGSYQLAE